MEAVPALDALDKQSERSQWEATLDPSGHTRQDATVAEITGLLGDLATWPKGHRVFVRREPLHPRYAKDTSAYELKHDVRLRALVTNTPGRQAAWLDCRHRTHARVESKIRDSKAESLSRFPSRLMKINQAWLAVTALACDLRAWLQLLALDGQMARVTPKTLRYRFLHVPAVIVRGQRKRRLKIPRTWPWVEEIVAAFGRLMILPHPLDQGKRPRRVWRGGKRTQSPGRWSPAPPTRQSTRTPTRTAPGKETNAASRAHGQAATTVKDRGRTWANTPPTLQGVGPGGVRTKLSGGCGMMGGVETFKRTPLQLFNLPQHFVIPLFQRPYVWKEDEQWEPLWKGIRRIAELWIDEPHLNATHFLGAVVIQSHEAQSKRLTT